jgi:hypothetical protein
MGHDTTAFRKEDDEVAYLRRSAFDERNEQIYELLDCKDCHAGVSGDGSLKEFTRDDIAAAIVKAVSDEKYNRELEFLTDCMINMEDGKIMIHFW